MRIWLEAVVPGLSVFQVVEKDPGVWAEAVLKTAKSISGKQSKKPPFIVFSVYQ
jgi:hypothetical protein